MTFMGTITTGKGLQKSLLTIGRHAGQSGHVGITHSSVKCQFAISEKLDSELWRFVAFLAGAKTFDARLRI